MGARGPYVEELLPPDPVPVMSVTWLDPQVLFDEFHREELAARRRWELLDGERWDRGDCGG